MLAKDSKNGRSERTAPCASSKRELTMRIAVMSDLHLEFDTGEARNDKDVGRRDRLDEKTGRAAADIGCCRHCSRDIERSLV